VLQLCQLLDQLIFRGHSWGSSISLVLGGAAALPAEQTLRCLS